jgi:uncharacterized phage protein (TIGR02218 family)
MRFVTPEVSAYLDATTLGFIAHAYTLTPRLEVAGSVYWTDTDANFDLNGHTYTSANVGDVPLIEYGGRDEAVGTEVGSCRVTLKCAGSGHLGAKTLPAAALDRDFDGAWLKIERVFLSAPGTVVGSMWLFEGPIAKASPTGTEVELEIEDGKALLRTKLPRVVYQPGCVNTFGDPMCGVSLASLTAGGTVTTGSTASVVKSDRMTIRSYYNLGVLRFTSGALSGVSRSVKDYVSGAFTLDFPLAQAPAAGDTFNVFPGCDKTLFSCLNRWGRSEADARSHFRGFPFVPKNETAE